jgi:hypothetical protein
MTSDFEIDKHQAVRGDGYCIGRKQSTRRDAGKLTQGVLDVRGSQLGQ